MGGLIFVTVWSMTWARVDVRLVPVAAASGIALFAVLYPLARLAASEFGSPEI